MEVLVLAINSRSNIIRSILVHGMLEVAEVYN